LTGLSSPLRDTLPVGFHCLVETGEVGSTPLHRIVLPRASRRLGAPVGAIVGRRRTDQRGRAKEADRRGGRQGRSSERGGRRHGLGERVGGQGSLPDLQEEAGGTFLGLRQIFIDDRPGVVRGNGLRVEGINLGLGLPLIRRREDRREDVTREGRGRVGQGRQGPAKVGHVKLLAHGVIVVLVEFVAHFGQIVIVEGSERREFRKPLHGVHVGVIDIRIEGGSGRGGEGISAIRNTSGTAQGGGWDADHDGGIGTTIG
jgi:hypothetical protein